MLLFLFICLFLIEIFNKTITTELKTKSSTGKLKTNVRYSINYEGRRKEGRIIITQKSPVNFTVNYKETAQ